MKKYNRKGFGLVMAIMTIMVLLIMAAGFFHVTNFSTKRVQKNIEDLRLYWAAESASNFNVNWWVNQPQSTRIAFPSTYAPPAKKTIYADINMYKIPENSFPHSDSTTTTGFYYLHASSLLEKDNNPVIDGFEILTVRYKGERKGETGEAVWVLDSYARDTATGKYSNIILTNVWNTTYESISGWNQNSEAIVFSVAGTGFNGALGAFHEKDIRYGDCYYADIIRLDMQTGGSDGARFYKGPVKSSALKSGSTLAQSRWGAVLEGTKDLIDVSHNYGYGLALRENWATEQEAIDRITESFTSQIDPNIKTPYIKDAAPLPTDNVLWSWRDVADYGGEVGILMLDSISGSGEVAITLTPSGPETICTITADGNTWDVQLGGTGYNGIAVPSNYGQVNISGVSNKSFTLVTETDQVNIVDDFYIQSAQTSLDVLTSINNNDPLSLEQTGTNEAVLEQLWGNMSTQTSVAQLSIISQLNDEKEAEGFPFYLQPGKRPDLLFTTCAFAAWNGMIGMPANFSNSPSMKFFNVGSAITFARQGVFGGDPSGAWTKALIQDRRYIPDTPDGGLSDPLLWGEGPSIIEQMDLTGLNRKHGWTKNNTGMTNDINRVAWPGGMLPTF